jgi:hypothetical protein
MVLKFRCSYFVGRNRNRSIIYLAVVLESWFALLRQAFVGLSPLMPRYNFRPVHI